jgi:hypothetical protein
LCSSGMSFDLATWASGRDSAAIGYGLSFWAVRTTARKGGSSSAS